MAELGFRWLLAALMVAFVGAASVLDLAGASRTHVWPVAALTAVLFIVLVVGRLLYIRTHRSDEDDLTG